MKSIERFMLVANAIVMLAGIIGTVTFVNYSIQGEVEELFDAELAQMARVIDAYHDIVNIKEFDGVTDNEHQIVPPTVDPAQSYYDQFAHRYEQKIFFEVWNQQGDPIFAIKPGDVELQLIRAPGFANEQFGADKWRTFTLYNDRNGLWIKTAQKVEIRRETTSDVSYTISEALTVVMALIGIIVVAVIRFGFKPIARVSNELTTRNEKNLAPLKIDQLPAEIEPLISRINVLMEQVDYALRSQRRFVSTAAHELRTPLAGIRIQAQSLQVLNDDQRAVQARILFGVDKLTRLFNQLLALSRAEALVSEVPESRLELNSLLKYVAGDYQALVREAQVVLELKLGSQVAICANSEVMETIVRNLIDNAIKYAAQGGLIQIGLDAVNDSFCFSVTDNGPGLSDEQKGLVLERFYRGKHQSIQGSGIGLALVKELCEQLGYTLTLKDAPTGETGLMVEVRGPRD